MIFNHILISRGGYISSSKSVVITCTAIVTSDTKLQVMSEYSWASGNGAVEQIWYSHFPYFPVNRNCLRKKTQTEKNKVLQNFCISFIYVWSYCSISSDVFAKKTKTTHVWNHHFYNIKCNIVEMMIPHMNTKKPSKFRSDNLRTKKDIKSRFYFKD